MWLVVAAARLKVYQVRMPKRSILLTPVSAMIFCSGFYNSFIKQFLNVECDNGLE